MPSERTQRRIDRLLDDAEQALDAHDWNLAAERARDVLLLDDANEDARNFLTAAERALAGEELGRRSSVVGDEKHSAQPSVGVQFITPAASVGEGLVPSRPEPEPRAEPAGDAAPPPEPTLLSSLPPSTSSGQAPREGGTAASGAPAAPSPSTTDDPAHPEPVEGPTTFLNRYKVIRFLGEGGKKQVYLAHDNILDRDVAFALIKTEGLDQTGRDRITREAQAMGRLGSHPHIVTVFDLGSLPSPGTSLPGPLPLRQAQGAALEGKGSIEGRPYIVTELMKGGDVEGLIDKASEHRPPLDRSIEIAVDVCRGLEFAHSHGIVHRDLKPGNVWLTEDGTAKLGDFGLAVALDRTRLTQAGMMVGTVSYMPPEQAMGGEVTPRADLYSLGAMLYELVTGRPPFVGDETVAIITQHLNVTPVAPSWHNSALPPALEALILRLLEKDPSRRPGSAAEVRTALASISASLEGARAGLKPAPTEGNGPDSVGAGLRPARAGQAPDGSPAALDNPMYRRAFVGREADLRQLQAAYDAATSGQGALVMVVGEPGIGKTSLCEQLATYAAVRGGRTLLGHCYEEGALSLPYLPFIEAMRSYVLQREPAALQTDLGSGAGEVARIVSEVRERLHVGPVPATADPGEDRYRLFQAIGGFLRNAALVQPLVIVLEDLHDADRGTLDLLLHLSRNLAGSRLLIVGTYRDIEVDRTHPLSATLAELRRGAGFGRVLLRGLTADEVQRMLSTISSQEVRWELAEAVHRQTEGNPLFVQEVLRYLVEEGLIQREGGRWRAASGSVPLAMAIPEGLRDVIGKRLARLSPDCNRLLSIAAVVGRDISLSTVAAISGRPREELSEALGEAVRTAVLSEQEHVGEVQYRFAHAFFRQTLYEELGAARRIQFHQQVARALEAQYAGRLGDHAAELAEHFAHSSDRADLAKAVQYAEAAADRAMGVYAYGEAVRHLEQALDVQEVLNPDDKSKHCHLLLALGDALFAGGHLIRLIEHSAPEALALAKGLDDRARASRACQQALWAIAGQEGSAAINMPSLRSWVGEASLYAAPGSVDRVLSDTFMALVLFFSDRAADGWSLLHEAGTLAETLGDSRASAAVAERTIMQTWLPENQAERLEVATVSLERIAAGTSLPARMAANLLNGASHVFVAWADRARAEEAVRCGRALADRTRHVEATISASEQQIMLLSIRGELEAAITAADELRQTSAQLGIPGLGRNFARRAGLWPLLHLGHADEAYENEAPPDKRLVEAGGSVSRSAATTLCLAYGGRTEQVQSYLAQLRDRLLDDHQRLRLQTSAAVNYLAAAVTVQDSVIAGRLRDDLRDMAHLISEIYPTCIARHLGAASVLLGERDEAMRFYEQALEVCGRLGFRPELALTHLEIAELLLGATGGEAGGAQAGRREPIARGGQDARAPREDRAEAMRHLDMAIAELRGMKMQPALERALRHKELLHA